MKFVSATGKKWIFKNFDQKKAAKISEKFSLDEIVSKLLTIKKVDEDEIKNFLNPLIKHYMPNPSVITDMDVGVKKVIDCLKNKEIIGIFGDYDVDGATSTAILGNYFKSINHPFEIYIPDRQKEGYGPSIDGFAKLIDKNIKTIITVDCGTSSYEAINFAKKKKVETIVLDHHQADIKLPEALAIINPNRVDANSNLNYLCATGICLMFLVSLNQKLRLLKWFESKQVVEPNIFMFLDLVCLGTVCDVVPLTGLNRAIVYQGLKVLKKRSNLGIKTLYDLCGIKAEPNTYHLGYVLGPRINAGGRLGTSSHGAELLISNDPQKTYGLATDLNAYNDKRKHIESSVTIKANKKAQKRLKDPILFLDSDDWHEGVIGIVASRIKDRYGKPTIIVSSNGEIGKGSARSIFGFDIGSHILAAKQSKILISGGGHKMAGGFSIEMKKMDEFKNFLFERYSRLEFIDNYIKNLYLDSAIYPSALNEDFYKKIFTLAPFGSGNTEPKFVIQDLRVVNSSILAEKHIKSILLSKGDIRIKTIAFNSIGSPLESYLTHKNNRYFNIAGKMSMNEWRGENKIEFIIDDISVN